MFPPSIFFPSNHQLSNDPCFSWAFRASVDIYLDLLKGQMFLVSLDLRLGYAVPSRMYPYPPHGAKRAACVDGLESLEKRRDNEATHSDRRDEQDQLLLSTHEYYRCENTQESDSRDALEVV